MCCEAYDVDAFTVYQGGVWNHKNFLRFGSIEPSGDSPIAIRINDNGDTVIETDGVDKIFDEVKTSIYKDGYLKGKKP